MAIHTVTTTVSKVYNPKKPTMIVLTTRHVAPYYLYVGKDEKALADYGILGADTIVNSGSAVTFIAKEPLFALSPSGAVYLGIMEV